MLGPQGLSGRPGLEPWWPWAWVVGLAASCSLEARADPFSALRPWLTGTPCRRSMKYMLCSDNHGIKPPPPEQYLTPLQQKEVCIRHLRARLKDTQDRLQDR